MAKRVEPKVILLAETRLTQPHRLFEEMGIPLWESDGHSDAEKLMEIAGKMCYMSFDTSLNKNLSRVGGRTNFDYLQQSIIGVDHQSVLEHASCTFVFWNVSRVLTHELVRHRHGSYSQLSGRYVRTDEIDYWLPSEVRNDAEAASRVHEMFATMEAWVHWMTTRFGVDQMGPKQFTLKKKLTSAFRRVIGNGQANHIVATYNHRAIRHILALRSSRHAEEEMRVVMSQVYTIVKERYPAVYADARVEMADDLPEITFPKSVD